MLALYREAIEAQKAERAYWKAHEAGETVSFGEETASIVCAHVRHFGKG